MVTKLTCVLFAGIMGRLKDRMGDFISSQGSFIGMNTSNTADISLPTSPASLPDSEIPGTAIIPAVT